MSMLPVDAVGEKTLRWWSEIVRSGAEPRFLAGKLNPSDGLSFNPPDRDELLADNRFNCERQRLRQVAPGGTTAESAVLPPKSFVQI
jgi:hypothetical protein